MAGARVMNRTEWAECENVWHGEFEGKAFGTNASVMFFSSDEIGKGPKLHQHPYDEIFIVRSGKAKFTVGDQEFCVTAGQIVFGPANVPHKYQNTGTAPLEMIDIHVSAVFTQIDLE
ncbi:cupin domain-containing protein [Agrobacterium rhizogenes]|uniref:cupin domain-containing protein n=1 Tax=Rhizobium rhizogenes TaxID=359 RepID=UPI0022B75117|nr:cupin domain-containing protein [Rhizobium rhizogenes]MCZ7451156.1 cupin domain-containing protein [Rhizobium rhizogenes]